MGAGVFIKIRYGKIRYDKSSISVCRKSEIILSFYQKKRKTEQVH